MTTSTVITLDRNREYGTVHGEDTGGAFYAQDGFHFDIEGNLLEHLMDKGAVTRLEKRLAVENATRKAEEAYKLAMAEAGQAEPEPVKVAPAKPGRIAVTPGEDEPPAAEDVEKFDFRGWYLGQNKVGWFEVSKALKTEMGYSANSKAAAAEFLSNELSIPLESFKA